MRTVWSLFPKLYRELGPHELCQLVHEVGLDTTNVVIRNGYAVGEDNVSQALPEFLKVCRGNGLRVTCASTTYSVDQLTAVDSPLTVMADCGIHEFRMGWFPKADQDILGALQSAKADMDRVAEIAAKHRIRAIYQVHHNTLITSASAAYNLVRGLPPEWIGVELDPGNQSFQGYEPWTYSVGLLGDYCAWMAVKDTVTWQEESIVNDPDKGWRRAFAPINKGVTNWQRVTEALKINNFEGTFVFMPFYSEDDTTGRTQKLKQEVAYLRQRWESKT